MPVRQQANRARTDLAAGPSARRVPGRAPIWLGGYREIRLGIPLGDPGAQGQVGDTSDAGRRPGSSQPRVHIRVRAAQDRVMNLRAREIREPDVAIARQRAENDLADLTRTRIERLAGLQRLTLAKHGPVRHVATALVLGSSRSVEEQIGSALDDLDPEIRRKCEIAAEDVVIAYETTRGFECERVGHLKIGFDVRSIGPADPQTGYRDPVTGIRRIEVKGRRRGQPVRLTTNEWYKATQLGDSYWLYVVYDCAKSFPMLRRVRDPFGKLIVRTKERVVIDEQAIFAAAEEDETWMNV